MEQGVWKHGRDAPYWYDRPWLITWSAGKYRLWYIEELFGSYDSLDAAKQARADEMKRRYGSGKG